MIEQSDIEIVDKEYFEIVEIKDFILVLQSRNTGHYWCLLERIYNGCRTFQISHRHHPSDPFHRQKSKPSIETCCDYIKSHDAYQLVKEHKKAERRQRRQAEKHGKKTLPR